MEAQKQNLTHRQEKIKVFFETSGRFGYALNMQREGKKIKI